MPIVLRYSKKIHLKANIKFRILKGFLNPAKFKMEPILIGLDLRIKIKLFGLLLDGF